MLNAAYQIGKAIVEQEDFKLSEYENFNEDGRYKHIIKIIFEVYDADLKYAGIEYEEFSKNRLPKYFYKRGGSRGGDITPTSKITDAIKTVPRVMSSIKNLLSSTDKNHSEYFILDKVYKYMEEQEKAIVKDVKEKAGEVITNKESGILTLVIRMNGRDLYVGDLDIVRKRLNQASLTQYYDKHNTISKGTGICYYCGSTDEVYGFVSTYQFYTVDKIGFVSGGFNQSKSWMNYPVCATCTKILETGKLYIEQKLNSSFCGFRYLVVPKITFGGDQDMVEVLESLDFHSNDQFTLGKSRDNLLASEKDFLDIMQDSSNNINYNILIFEEKQSGAVFRILLYIEDVVPSEIKKIIYQKDAVDQLEIFHQLPGKEGRTYDLKYDFSKLRHIFPSSKTEGNFDKEFLEIVNSVFSRKKINYPFLMQRIMGKISTQFLRDENYGYTALTSLMNVMFFNRLGLFDKKVNCEVKRVIEKNKRNEVYLNFFEQYPEVYDEEAKKAAFLCGVLVSHVLRAQWNELDGSTPFYERLNGLKLSPELLQRIFVEAFNKIKEYNSFFKGYDFADLRQLISEYLSVPNNLSNNDISFYFTLGMSLARKFVQFDQKKKEEEKQ